MQEKVYVIGDSRKKPGRPVTPRNVYSRSRTPQNPAKAFSLSLVVWGGGQFYNDQQRAGTYLLLLMVPYIAFCVSVAFFWGTVGDYLDTEEISKDKAFVFIGLTYITGLVVWTVNAFQAYFKARAIGEEKFGGVRSKVLPGLCSFVFPGWGQFLNGQAGKGIFLPCSP